MKKNFLSIFTIMTLVAALFMLCSCSPENNTQNADPSASVNWHDAPFNECDEEGNLKGVTSCDEWILTKNYKRNASEYESKGTSFVSASLDGGFFYALICRKGIGWCLDTYKKAADDFEGTTYEFNDVKYDLDNPLSSYQLTIENPKATSCFAFKADNGKVYCAKAFRVIKTKNIVEGSIAAKENTAYEGDWYYAMDTSFYSNDEIYYPTQVFLYESIDGTSLEPKYVVDQVKAGVDTYDSSKEGWNKGTISAIAGCFPNGKTTVTNLKNKITWDDSLES